MSKRFKFALAAVLAVAAMTGAALQTFSHCQIPCGIYGDETRFTMLMEHIATIEKSMTQIEELSAQDDINPNQIVRWVTNKEEHAAEFTDIVTFYFLAQRIKPAEKGSEGYETYQSQLEMLHHMIVFAMKCKQTTDLENTEKLKQLVGDFKESYFKK